MRVQSNRRGAGWGLLGLALAALAAAGATDPAPGASQGGPVQTQALDSLTNDLDEVKRAWNNLHGGWGKRGWQDMNSAWGKRAWQNLHGGWGKRGWKDMNAAWGKRAWNNLHGGWGKRAWNNLHGGWGKRDAADLLELLASSPSPLDQDYVDAVIDAFAPMNQVLNNNAEKTFENEADPDAEKRNWSSLHGTWGKRSADKWSNFRGSWGKREPGWNNLKGLWGKRSSMDPMDDSQGTILDRQEE